MGSSCNVDLSLQKPDMMLRIMFERSDDITHDAECDLARCLRQVLRFAILARHLHRQRERPSCPGGGVVARVRPSDVEGRDMLPIAGGRCWGKGADLGGLHGGFNRRVGKWGPESAQESGRIRLRELGFARTSVPWAGRFLTRRSLDWWSRPAPAPNLCPDPSSARPSPSIFVAPPPPRTSDWGWHPACTQASYGRLPAGMHAAGKSLCRRRTPSQDMSKSSRRWARLGGSAPRC